MNTIDQSSNTWQMHQHRPTSHQTPSSLFRPWWSLAMLTSLAMLGSMMACSPAQHQILPAMRWPVPPPAQTWPDMPGQILEDVAHMRIHAAKLADGARHIVADLDHRRRIQILDEPGLSLAQIRLPIDAYSTIDRVVARSVAPDGTVLWLDPGTIELAAQKGTDPSSNTLQEYRWTIPGAQVGGVIEYRYRRRYLAPTLVPPWSFAKALPVVRAEFSFSNDRNVSVAYKTGVGAKTTDEMPIRREDSSMDERWIFQHKNLSPLYPEPRMPHPTRLAPWVALTLRSTRLGFKTLRWQTWSDVGSSALALLRQVEGPLRAEADPRLIYRQVSQAVEPLLLDGRATHGLGVQAPLPLRHVQRGVPVTSRDAAAYLWRALSDAGVRAYPALLTTQESPEAYDDFPALYPFESMLVAMEVRAQDLVDKDCTSTSVEPLCRSKPGELLFLDPMCKHCALGELPLHQTSKRALVLYSNARTGWVDIPSPPPATHRTELNLNLTMEVGGATRGRGTLSLHGLAARRARKAFDRHPGDNVAHRLHLNQVVGSASSNAEDTSFEAPNIEIYRIENSDQTVGILKAKARYESQATESSINTLSISPAQLAGVSLPHPMRLSHRYLATLDIAPAWYETTATIALPTGFTAQPKAPSRIVTPWAEYAAGFAFRRRGLVYSRRLVLKKRFYTPQEWAAFRKFLSQIYAIENQALRITQSNG